MRAKSVRVKDIKKLLPKLGVEEVSLPFDDGDVVAFSFSRRGDNIFAVVCNQEERFEIPINPEDYKRYLKYGDARYRPRRRSSSVVLNEVKKVLAERGEVTLPELYKMLSSKGVVRYRSHLYQVVRNNFVVDYIERGGRRVLLIRG